MARLVRPTEAERRIMYDHAVHFLQVKVKHGVNAAARIAPFSECDWHENSSHFICPVYGFMDVTFNTDLTGALDDCVPGSGINWQSDAQNISGRWVIRIPALEVMQTGGGGTLKRRVRSTGAGSSCMELFVKLLVAALLVSMGYAYIYLIK
jgi:hypothetical protein